LAELPKQPVKAELPKSTGGIDFLDGVKNMDAFKEIESQRFKEVLEIL